MFFSVEPGRTLPGPESVPLAPVQCTHSSRNHGNKPLFCTTLSRDPRCRSGPNCPLEPHPPIAPQPFPPHPLPRSSPFTPLALFAMLREGAAQAGVGEGSLGAVGGERVASSTWGQTHIWGFSNFFSVLRALFHHPYF